MSKVFDGLNFKMFTKFCVFVFLVLCGLINYSQAAECEPISVTNLTLQTNHFLTWSVRDEEPCEITEFLIYIFHRNRPVEYIFTVTDPTTNVSFLGVCQQWTFVVIPISEHTLGREQRLDANLPLPIDADLTISSINITRAGPINDIHLEWGLADSQLGSCSLQYRLTVEIDGNPYIEDIYLRERTINLRFLSPCSTYQFGVRAINIGVPTTEGPLRTASYHIPAVRQGAPRLISVTPDYNGFNSTWMIENADRNGCPIRLLYLDGGVLFRKEYQLDDSAARGPINVTVTGLRANTMYYFRTYLVNTAGYSAPAPAAVQTLNFT